MLKNVIEYNACNDSAPFKETIRVAKLFRF